MRLSAILDPIDARAFMPEKEATDNGIRISNSAVAILLFLFAQTVGAVWWASSANEKLNNVNTNMAAQRESVVQLDKTHQDQRAADQNEVKAVKDRLERLERMYLLKFGDMEARDKNGPKLH